jgi:two-component system, OmpR family, response regulator CpxR
MDDVNADSPLIALIEDEEHLAQGLLFNLQAENYRVHHEADGDAALAYLLAAPPSGPDKISVIVLDCMLPGTDGFAITRALREAQRYTPILMLTARSHPGDILEGLEAGADDYLPKPFGTAELLARIRAVLRRATRAPIGAEVLEAGGVKLIPTAREALSDGSPVALTTVEYDILEYLVHAAGRVVSRDELTAALYQRRTTRFDRSLDMHICNLRKKLDGNGELIRTVRGVGFLFRSGSGHEDPRGA